MLGWGDKIVPKCSIYYNRRISNAFLSFYCYVHCISIYNGFELVIKNNILIKFSFCLFVLDKLWKRQMRKKTVSMFDEILILFVLISEISASWEEWWTYDGISGM